MLLPSVGFFPFFPPFGFFLFSFLVLVLFLPFVSSNTPQQIWLIHLLTDEPFLNALVRGTILCGNVATHNNVVDNMILPRPEVPPAPRLRKVLAIVDLQSVHLLMNKAHDDVMDATTCDVLPSLSRVEERALFTYNVLLNTHRLESLTVYNLLYCISQHIWYTWDRYLPPSSMDIRWQDDTGDTFALRNENRLVDLLHDYRPHWTEGQEFGILFPNDIRHFTSHFQPYIMRMSCHEALPNRNMLP